jgi:SAM-dependent methyltransferase
MSHAEHLGQSPTSELWGEHRARYRFAARYVHGKRVLDIACGAGFGLQMLRQAGAYAVGMDLDTQALREAQPITGPSVAQANALLLPIADERVDVVSSFETIEHVTDAAAFIAELRRVLRPGGMLILSTPNREFGPPTSNPYHIQEFSRAELHALLRQAFAEVAIYGQWPDPSYRYVPYRMIEPDTSPAALLWKTANRLPFGVKDRLAHSLTGRSWYPGEAHYCFEEGRTAGAHALLAVAS